MTFLLFRHNKKHVSLRTIANEFNISIPTAWRVLRKTLGWYPYKPQIVVPLSDRHRFDRVTPWSVHTTTSARAWLKHKVSRRVSSRLTDRGWPTRIPDLSPRDLWFWWFWSAALPEVIRCVPTTLKQPMAWSRSGVLKAHSAAYKHCKISGTFSSSFTGHIVLPSTVASLAVNILIFSHTLSHLVSYYSASLEFLALTNGHLRQTNNK